MKSRNVNIILNLQDIVKLNFDKVKKEAADKGILKVKAIFI